MINSSKVLFQLYDEAQALAKNDLEFTNEVEWQRNVSFENQNAEEFFYQYVWVVLCSGFKATIARRYEKRFIESGRRPEDLNVELIYGNMQKRNAIRKAQANYREWFKGLQSAKDKIAYLDLLPFIGPITKFHLAKNLGIGDLSKPDVHLTKLQNFFGSESVNELCGEIASRYGEKIAVVDLILWHYCEVTPNYESKILDRINRSIS